MLGLFCCGFCYGAVWHTYNRVNQLATFITLSICCTLTTHTSINPLRGILKAFAKRVSVNCYHSVFHSVSIKDNEHWSRRVICWLNWILWSQWHRKRYNSWQRRAQCHKSAKHRIADRRGGGGVTVIRKCKVRYLNKRVFFALGRCFAETGFIIFLAKHLNGVNSAFSDGHGFQASDSYWLLRICGHAFRFLNS